MPEAIGRLVSVALAHGAKPEEIGRALQGAPLPAKTDCPECGDELRFEEGCVKCECGYSRC